jgi:serine/threonine protein kinase
MAIRVQIDGYDSLEQIGVGGMAAVYKARKISIDKTVAIKVLFPYLATDASFTERFQREAKAAASIQHENIVNVVDFGESEGSFYIVMEYYQGRTLEDLIKSRPGIPVDIATQIILEVAYGLEAAHHLDIVHRDVKPANIIFTNQGGIKVADFGLAKKSDSMTMITQQGKVIGTPAYMSPEQAAGRPVGTASDIFSLGVVAYELLGRRRPFEGKSYSDVLEMIQTHTPASLADVNPVIEPEFATIVARMLEKNDRNRYANASALVGDLEAAMEKAKIVRDRRRLTSYIKDPTAYETAFLEKTVTGCLSRGSFYLQKGQGQLEEAALEFRRILFLDPANERALKNLERINSRRGVANVPVVQATKQLVSSAGAATTRMVTPRASSKTKPRRRGRWVWGGVGVVVAAGAVALWIGTRNPVAIAPSQGSVPTSAGLAEAPTDGIALGTAGDTVTQPVSGDSAAGARADSSRVANGPAKPNRAPDTKTAVGTSRDDAPRAGTSGGEKSPPRKDVAVASREPSKSAGTPSKKPAERPDTLASGTKAATTAATSSKGAANGAGRPTPERPAPVVATPANGTLSIYFLGGVGEVFVDGRRFEHQPPFEGISMPAGSYRIACRMSGDATPKEIVVSIRPNRETVVEYEIGNVPIVTAE